MMTDQIVAGKMNKIQALVDALVELVDTAVEDRTSLHEVEREVLSHVLRIGREAIGRVFDKLGLGNVGPTCELPGRRAADRGPSAPVRPQAGP